jgi:hypothetical protein
MPHLDDHIRYLRPFLLDEVAVALGPWSGYNVLAQHLNVGKSQADQPVGK